VNPVKPVEPCNTEHENDLLRKNCRQNDNDAAIQNLCVQCNYLHNTPNLQSNLTKVYKYVKTVSWTPFLWKKGPLKNLKGNLVCYQLAVFRILNPVWLGPTLSALLSPCI